MALLGWNHRKKDDRVFASHAPDQQLQTLPLNSPFFALAFSPCQFHKFTDNTSLF